MRDVFIIAGPGGMAYGKEEIDLLNNNILSNDNANGVSIVGDGETTLKLEDISEQLTSVAQTTEPVTIIIQMHGTVKDGQFYFLNDDERISSKYLFSMISQKFADRPIDILVSSCHSGACLADKDILPKESVVRCIIAR